MAKKLFSAVIEIMAEDMIPTFL